MKKTQKRKEIQRRKTKWRTLSKVTLEEKTLSQEIILDF
jgi:hypothetical protein